MQIAHEQRHLPERAGMSPEDRIDYGYEGPRG